MKKQHVILIAIIALFIYSSTDVVYTSKRAEHDEFQYTPTVFLHGYKGTYYSFGNMLDRYQNEYGWGDKGLIYHVGADGSLDVEELLKTKGKPLFVQVIFENNRASFQDGSTWLAAVLQDLKKRYFINEVNLVGHSMGGILSVKYILDYKGTIYPNVNKLVTIGSPFDGIYDHTYFLKNPQKDLAAKDLMPGSEGLKSLRNKDFPNTIQVLSVASTGDRVAKTKSVQTLRKILRDNPFEEKVIDDKRLGHSMLHESKRVDRLVYDFLYSQP